MGADKQFEEKDVLEHNTEDDCWLILGEIGERKVYDVTKFLDDHPGGPEIMVDVAGACAIFRSFRYSACLSRFRQGRKQRVRGGRTR
jgi:cytochrome b involved in lipid metabolism